MNVEGGGISTGPGPGSAIGGISAPSIEFGRVMGLSDISPIVNEGPVGGGLAMFKPIGQINFIQSEAPRPRLGGVEVPKVFQAGLSDVNLDPQSEDLPFSPAVQLEPKIVVSDASRLEVVRERISGLAIPQTQPDFLPFLSTPALEPAPKSKGVLLTQAATQPQAEIKIASGPAIQALVLEDQQVEELIEKTVAVKDEDAQIESRQTEASEEVKIQRIVDKPVVKQRIEEIIAAAIAVQLEEKDAEGVIAGQKIVGKLPFQHKKNRSGELNIVDPEGKLLDGSLLATIKKIASGKFSSLMDAIKRVPKIVAEDRPVTRGEGQVVTDEDVAKVYEQYKGKVPPAQQVFRRVVRMVKQVKIVERYEEVVEKTEGVLHPEVAAALLVPKDFQK